MSELKGYFKSNISETEILPSVEEIFKVFFVYRKLKISPGNYIFYFLSLLKSVKDFIRRTFMSHKFRDVRFKTKVCTSILHSHIHIKKCKIILFFNYFYSKIIYKCWCLLSFFFVYYVYACK